MGEPEEKRKKDHKHQAYQKTVDIDHTYPYHTQIDRDIFHYRWKVQSDGPPHHEYDRPEDDPNSNGYQHHTHHRCSHHQPQHQALDEKCNDAHTDQRDVKRTDDTNLKLKDPSA